MSEEHLEMEIARANHEASQRDKAKAAASGDGLGGWKIYRVNDCDWWMARSIDELREEIRGEYGDDDYIQEDELRELTEDDLDTTFFLVDGYDEGPKILFREELNNRIANNPKPQLFASTEL